MAGPYTGWMVWASPSPRTKLVCSGGISTVDAFHESRTVTRPGERLCTVTVREVKKPASVSPKSRIEGATSISGSHPTPLPVTGTTTLWAYPAGSDAVTVTGSDRAPSALGS